MRKVGGFPVSENIVYVSDCSRLEIARGGNRTSLFLNRCYSVRGTESSHHV